jgi:hypothetical protein
MVIELSPQLVVALSEQARMRGVTLETLVLETLRDRYLPHAIPVEPHDDWERKLFESAFECGVTVSDAALSSETLYE